MKPPKLVIQMEQDPYYFLLELREVLVGAGFKIEGKYIDGLDKLIERLKPLLADDIVAAQQMTLPVSGAFAITYADMCWDHDEDD